MSVSEVHMGGLGRSAWAVLALCIAASGQANGPTEPVRTEIFVWRYGTHELGTLDVPSGFTEDTENYREGIVTRLRYPDGSCVILQRGFMYRIPMFQDPENVLDVSKTLNDRTVRRGHYDNKREVWGEDDYAAYKPTPKGSLLEAISPNLGFEHVPRERRKEFSRAIESFIASH